MMQHEFENMALRGGAHIGPELYASIERFYMEETEYHATHGGIYETKRDFVRRVYGGKVNTPKTIAEKTAAESIRENRYALRGTGVTKERLDEMDAAITDFYMSLYRHNW